MLRLSETSIPLSIILLAMGSRALASLTCPAEPWLGLVLAASGAAILVSQLKLPAGLIVSGIVFAATSISTPVLKLFAWRLHDVDLHNAFYYIVGRVVPGLARSGDLFTFWTGRNLEAVRLTFEGLGLYEIWYLVVGLMVFDALTGRRLTAAGTLRSAAAVGVYMVLRSLVVTSIAIELGRPEIVWRPLYSILSWLPLAGVLRLGAIRPDLCGRGRRVFSLSRKGTGTLATVLGIGLGIGLVLAFLLGYEDPGHLKDGRVMIDEAHADWEWADEPFDTTAYGIRAEYNYYCLREYLSHFYTVSVNSESISTARLDSIDVLMIKTPTEPFGAGEIDAIEAFVAGGGGLLLIGDHTNLFGMSTHLDALGERFGMRFRCDDTFDIVTTGFSHYRKPRSGFHPAAREVRDFGFLTSCSIEGGMRTRPVMLGCGLGSEEADYSHPNFFGNIAYELCDRFGVFLQAGAAAFGEGRVMLFSDSTCFSNFCMFSPGRCELALGLIDYLNRRGTRYPFVTPLMLGLIGLLGTALALCVLRRGRSRAVGWSPALILPALLAGGALGLFGTSHVNAALYGSLGRLKTDSVVLFDAEHTTASFFTYPGVLRRPGTMGFEALYLCAQRIGAHPSTGGLGELRTIQPSGVVVVNPTQSFSKEDLIAVDTFLKEGGTLLLLESIRNGASTANELLGHYGIGIGPIRERDARTGCITPLLKVRGGIGLSHDESGRIRTAFVPVGKGVLLVAIDSFSYSHHVMGSLLERSRPSPAVRDLYSEIYILLGNLIQ
jgi:hypothetical protein